jgi:hypothetical protein
MFVNDICIHLILGNGSLVCCMYVCMLCMYVMHVFYVYIRYVCLFCMCYISLCYVCYSMHLSVCLSICHHLYHIANLGTYNKSFSTRI